MKSDKRKLIELAIAGIEEARNEAGKRQELSGVSDRGFRSQVTSGGHLDAVADVIADVFVDAGLRKDEVFKGKRDVVLPGFYRPEKSWDIVAIHDGKLIAAIELKSIWSSYGNNMNNRTEEAVGSGCDLRMANKYGLFGGSAPWLGYVFVIRDDPAIHGPTRFCEPHYPVDKEYQSTGYFMRSIITCKRLMAERVYDRVFYALYVPGNNAFVEPDEDMTWAKFEAAIKGKVAEALA